MLPITPGTRVVSSNSGSRGTRTHKRSVPSPVFKTGSSSGRMTSVHSIKLRGLESNQRPPGSEPGVTTSSNYPGILLGHRWCGKARREGIEPPSPGSKPDGVPLAHPRTIQSARRESNPPIQLGRLVPEPIGQGHELVIGHWSFVRCHWRLLTTMRPKQMTKDN